MTEQQVRELYPQATPIPPDPNIKVEVAKLRIEKFEVAGKPFSVAFFFDSAGGLHEVGLSTSAKYDWELSSVRDRLEELLTQKYGVASIRTPERDGGLRIIWNKPDLIVSLHYSALPALSTYMLNIDYERPKSDALDHL